jgi:hypothetical protein
MQLRFWVLLIGLGCVTRTVAAQAEETAAETGVDSDATAHRPGFGLLLGLGLHTGLALGARSGFGDFGVELTGGYQLLFSIAPDGEAGIARDELNAGSSAQFGTELYWTPWHPLPTTAIGLKSGYRYNTVLHHGFAVAITFLISLSDSIALEGLAGAQIFPGSGDRLRRHFDLPPGADLGYSSSYQFFEYGFEFIWYP